MSSKLPDLGLHGNKIRKTKMYSMQWSLAIISGALGVSVYLKAPDLVSYGLIGCLVVICLVIAGTHSYGFFKDPNLDTEEFRLEMARIKYKEKAPKDRETQISEVPTDEA